MCPDVWKFNDRCRFEDVIKVGKRNEKKRRSKQSDRRRESRPLRATCHRKWFFLWSGRLQAPLQEAVVCRTLIWNNLLNSSKWSLSVTFFRVLLKYLYFCKVSTYIFISIFFPVERLLIRGKNTFSTENQVTISCRDEAVFYFEDDMSPLRDCFSLQRLLFWQACWLCVQRCL